MDENPYKSPQGHEAPRARSSTRVLDRTWRAILCLTSSAGVGGLVLLLANIELGWLLLQVAGGSGILALALMGLSLAIKTTILVLGKIIGQ